MIIKYNNTGVTSYAITFEYDHENQIQVRSYQNNQYVYLVKDTDWEFNGATAIEFITAVPDTFEIVRETDMSRAYSPASATPNDFAQGSSIKAREINNNLEWLRTGIEESQSNEDNLQDQVNDINEELDDINQDIVDINGNLDFILALRPNISQYFQDGLNAYQQFDDDTLVLNVSVNGDVTNATGNYEQFSDSNLKTNITDAASQWDDVKAMRVVNYELLNEKFDERLLGWIAQEVEQISPGLVTTRDFNGTEVKSIKQSILFIKAFKALQEAMARIEQLEAQ